MLCDAIVDGTLAPGEPLHDDQLCSWLGLSRTPLREALGRLREERLVEMEPQRFTRVSPVSLRDVRDLVPLLATIHGLATELAVPRLQPSHLRDLRARNDEFIAALRAQSPAAAYEADDAFHAVIVDAAGNAEIPAVLTRLMPRLHRLECLGGANLPGRRSVAQHEALITRAQIGDAAGAAAAARANWITLGSVLERAFASD
jgi:DNA-binding GntR family transcriptional regulator